MPVSGKGTAVVVGAFALAAVLSACAVPSSGTDAAYGTTSTTAFGSLRGTSRPPDISDLAGLRPADVVSILGQPDLERDEPPAELWQYRAADCVLNLFFYDDAGSYRLTHAETWQRTLSASGTPAHCHDEDAPIKAHFITQSSL